METKIKRIYVGQQWFTIINEDDDFVVVQKTNHVDGEWEIDGQPINLPRASYDVWRGDGEIDKPCAPRNKPLRYCQWDSFGLNSDDGDLPSEVNAKRSMLNKLHRMDDVSLWDDKKGMA